MLTIGRILSKWISQACFTWTRVAMAIVTYFVNRVVFYSYLPSLQLFYENNKLTIQDNVSYPNTVVPRAAAVGNSG